MSEALQWGLDHVIEDLRTSRRIPLSSTRLQWGLDHVVEDLQVVNKAHGELLELQWGLDHVVEDLQEHGAEKSRGAGFNGASTTWSRICGALAPAPPGPRGFNGASTTWSRIFHLFSLVQAAIQSFNGASTTWSRICRGGELNNPCLDVLQWGLDHVVEDLATDADDVRITATLQWGLDHVVEDLASDKTGGYNNAYHCAFEQVTRFDQGLSRNTNMCSLRDQEEHRSHSKI